MRVLIIACRARRVNEQIPQRTLIDGMTGVDSGEQYDDSERGADGAEMTM